MVQEAKKEIRKIVSLKASLVSETKKLSAIVENLSEHSLYLTAVPFDTFAELAEGECFEVRLKAGSGEDITLPGRLKWFYETPPYGLTTSLGIEIKEDNPAYKKFFNNL